MELYSALFFWTLLLLIVAIAVIAFLILEIRERNAIITEICQMTESLEKALKELEEEN